MKNQIKHLNHSTVSSYQIDGNSLIINFGSRRLTIHNKWKIHTTNGISSDASLLFGAEVTNFLSSDNTLRIEFGEILLDVDFSEDAWTGPEAAIFYIDDIPVIVWS